MRVRVVSWNIHKCIGGADRRYRPDRVISVLRHHAPDVALLQEVACGMPRSRFHDQVVVLGDALGLPYRVYGPQHRFTMGGYGNAILSRWPLGGVAHVDLTVGRRKKRGALRAWSRVRVGPRHRTVVFHNLHLGLAGSERRIQLWRFLSSSAVAGVARRTPTVLGGDFNDLWGTLERRILSPAGFARAGRAVNTFPAVLPIRPLDGVFVRGDLVAHRCVPCRSELARQASDHLPLVADLEIAATSGT